MIILPQKPKKPKKMTDFEAWYRNSDYLEKNPEQYLVMPEHPDQEPLDRSLFNEGARDVAQLLGDWWGDDFRTQPEYKYHRLNTLLAANYMFSSMSQYEGAKSMVNFLLANYKSLPSIRSDDFYNFIEKYTNIRVTGPPFEIPKEYPSLPSGRDVYRWMGGIGRGEASEWFKNAKTWEDYQKVLREFGFVGKERVHDYETGYATAETYLNPPARVDFARSWSYHEATPGWVLLHEIGHHVWGALPESTKQQLKEVRAGFQGTQGDLTEDFCDFFATRALYPERLSEETMSVYENLVGAPKEIQKEPATFNVGAYSKTYHSRQPPIGESVYYIQQLLTPKARRRR